MKSRTVLMLLTCLLLATAAHAQRNKLEVGDAAPELNIESWIKGEQTAIEEDHVYVIEFWATWCGPCKRAIPQLSALQKQHEVDGLRIIGISTEEEDTVRDYVRSQGSKINYTIAVDDNKKSDRNWKTAAKLDGIPAAFIVDRRGRIQFIGNPHDPQFTRVLKLVINGRYDAKLYAEVLPRLNAVDNAVKMRNWREAMAHLDKAIERDDYIFAPLELAKVDLMMFEMGEPQAAMEYARSLLDSYADDWELHMRLAEMIVSDPRIEKENRDLALAKDAIDSAVAGARDQDNPQLLSVQAMVQFERGEADEAVSLQRRAWMIATPARKPGYERVLRRYQREVGRDSESGGGSSSSRGGTFR